MTVLAIKAAVRARDGNRCTNCGMTNEQHVERYGKSLHVHRLEPGSAYTLGGCRTLCYGCHGKEPKRPRRSLCTSRGRNLNLWLRAEVVDGLDELCRQERRTKTGQVELLLTEYLKSHPV